MATVCTYIIHFDDSEFTVCHSEEVIMFLLTLSIYVKIQMLNEKKNERFKERQYCRMLYKA